MCFRLFPPITESSGSSLTMQHVDIKTESSNTKTNTKEQEYVLHFYVIPCTFLIVEGFIRVQREWIMSLRHACFPLEILRLQVFQFGLVLVFHSSLIYQVLCFSPRPWLARPLETVVHLRVVRSTAVQFIRFSPLFSADWLKILWRTSTVCWVISLLSWIPCSIEHQLIFYQQHDEKDC